MKLIIVDTETSDLDPATGAAILEIAWAALHYNESLCRCTETLSAYETYIQYDGPISPKAQASHHICASCLKAPRAIPRGEAVGKLYDLLDEETFLVAHNSDFDSKFLPEIYRPWICTYKSAKRIWPNAPGHSNQVLRYWLNVHPDLSIAPNIKPRAPHQAFYDVATTVAILNKMLETFTPNELYEHAKPVLLKTIEFGKHKGLPFNQVPRDYLAWLRGQPNLDKDLEFTLDSILRS